MPPPLSRQIVALTGASSGIGRATAVEIGRRGASLVLAARSEEGLRDTAREAEAAGGRAEVVVTDVAEWPHVERLAAAAVARFAGSTPGRITLAAFGTVRSEFTVVMVGDGRPWSGSRPGRSRPGLRSGIRE